jgi:hypothetical protein
MTVDLSRERRRRAVSIMKAKRTTLATLDRKTQLVYAVALLMADESWFAEADVITATADPSVVQVASTLLVKAGLATGGDRS